MRTIAKFNNDKDIPPLSEREWNYSFEVGERVKLIPEMVKNFMNNPFSFTHIDPSYLDVIGVIMDCYPDLHCNLGTSYICLVNFNGVEKKFMSHFLYTSSKFYK